MYINSSTETTADDGDDDDDDNGSTYVLQESKYTNIFILSHIYLNSHSQQPGVDVLTPFYR